MLGQISTGRELQAGGADLRDDGVRRSYAEWLRFPAVDGTLLRRLLPELASASERLLEEAVQDHRYAPYLERQAAEITRRQGDDAILLPDRLDYAAIPGLSREMTERLSRSRPDTLGAAARLRGITPAALTAILAFVRGGRMAA